MNVPFCIHGRTWFRRLHTKSIFISLLAQAGEVQALVAARSTAVRAVASYTDMSG